VDGGWRQLWAQNRDTVRNPNLIRVGQTLAV
jgi:nucleoid-associated protein YgaU